MLSGSWVSAQSSFKPDAADLVPVALDPAALIAVDPVDPPAVVPEPVPVPETLKGKPVPEPSNLSQFVRNRQAAIQLGKALFWDMQVGSDGIQSCATCHFHAGVDNRSKNALSPGLNKLAPNFEPRPDKGIDLAPPNSKLTAAQFPFHKLANPDDRKSRVLADVNDAAGSQGIARSGFSSMVRGNANETLLDENDDVFFVNALNLRQVEPRNTPTTINAVFNRRNFWDGRAQEYFNGVNPFGKRDANAKVLFATDVDHVQWVSVRLNRASLASQAVGPPLSDFEMSGIARSFSHVGMKLLSLKPLAKQQVSKTDSVLGGSSLFPANGLNVPSYAHLVAAAFRPQWWMGKATIDSSGGTVTIGEKPGNTNPLTKCSQMEQNFSLFFGLAIQLYESTLVSDDSPFDRHVAGDTKALTDQQKRGLSLFFGRAKCAQCHNGPNFTSADFRTRSEPLNHMIMGDGGMAIYDEGFYNTGVRPTMEDIGVGGYDPFGFPLSETLLLQEQGPEVFTRITGLRAPTELLPFINNTAVDGAFKTPNLRNIELTGPYFHNGSQATLRQVMDFYNRGGDFHERNIANLDPDIENLKLTSAEREDIVAFMRSLTDARVKLDKAPFDHPQLFIPDGALGDQKKVYDRGDGYAKDSLITLPAVGAAGWAGSANFLNLK